MTSQSPRLYVPFVLESGQDIFLDGAQSHYVLHVMRLQVGSTLRLFHETSGEWEACLTQASRGKARARVQRCLREPDCLSPEIHMFFAPPRPQRLDWMVEKVTEIGVTHLHPILTQRTVVRQIHGARLQKIAVEATEQSIRLQPPILSPLTPAVEALTTQASDMPVLFCDPLAPLPLTAVLATTKSAPKVALAVGPEGGWTPQERDQILTLPHARAVHLGPQILRVETAALVATTLAIATLAVSS